MSKKNILAAFFALLVFGGCSDELTLSNRQPELVRFGTAMRMNPQTRTSYDNDGGTIYWDENDQIKIVAVNNKNNELKESLFLVRPLADPTVGKIQQSEGDGLYWRPGDSFLFYGFYPTELKEKFDFSTEKLVGLTVGAEQPTSVDMSAVYMVARTASDYNEDPVSLYFHPLVTTVTLIVKNEMDNTEDKNNVTISNLMLSSDEYYLAGSYKVGVGEGSGSMLTHEEIVWPTIGDLSETTSSVKISNANNRITIGQPEDVFNFLLIPQTYEGSKIKLSFDVVNSEQYSAYLGGENADLTFRPGHRYFFEVTIKENGEITPPKKIGNPEAQMIFALLLQQNHFTLWELLGDYFTEYFGYKSADPDLLNGLWNNKIESVKNMGLEQMYDELIKWFPDDKLNGLLDAIGSLEKIELDGNGPKLTADTLDFWIFKNAKKINFAIREKSDAEKEGGCREIIFDSLNDLEFIDITGEGSGYYNFTLSNCHNLKQCDLRNKSGLKLNKIDVTNCSSHEEVDFAYIRFSGEQQWGDFTINRHEGTEEIKFEWGYYDVISWYPLEYGEWHPQYTE